LDSFPLKIVEYSAARVALVVSDTPAHRNILNNGQCLFFPEGNVDSLVKQIGRLILDSRKCKQISEKAFFWVKDLTYENRVNKAISFYNNYTKSIKK
jgi:glycosyltransferase involved in cell wall biosynthesis